MLRKGLKSLEEAPQSNLYESLEHPRNSWIWEFTIAQKLRDLGLGSLQLLKTCGTWGLRAALAPVGAEEATAAI
jgi:hypothetical protein